MEFSRQEYWSGFPFPSPGDLPNPGIKPGFPALQANSLPSEPPPESPALEDRFLNTGPPGNSPKTFSKVRKLQAWTHYIYTYMSMCMCVLVAQSCPTLCDSSDCNSPGSSVHGTSQASILEWVSISFSRGSSWLRDQTHISWIGRKILYHLATWETLGLCRKVFKHLIKLPNVF